MVVYLKESDVDEGKKIKVLEVKTINKEKKIL